MSAELAELVTRGIALYKKITSLQEELKGVEEEITSIALQKSDEHQRLADDEREGRRFLARSGHDPDAPIVPVIFTADKLISSFEEHSVEHQRLVDAAGDKLPLLYNRAVMFSRIAKDGKAFRSFTVKHFGEKADAIIVAARELDSAGLPKSDIKIEWKNAGTEADILAGPRKKKAKKGKAVAK